MDTFKKLNSTTWKTFSESMTSGILRFQQLFENKQQSMFIKFGYVALIILLAIFLSFLLRFIFPELPDLTKENKKSRKKKREQEQQTTDSDNSTSVTTGIVDEKIAKNVKEVHEKISQNVAVPFFVDMTIYIVYIAAAFISLNVLGVSSIHMVAIISSLGIAVALGLQNVLSDLASGLLIATEGNFKIGDVVSVDNVTGKVRKVTLFRTGIQEIQTNSLVYVPNKLIHDTKFKNLSTDKYVAATIAISVSNRSFPQFFNTFVQAKSLENKADSILLLDRNEGTLLGDTDSSADTNVTGHEKNTTKVSEVSEVSEVPKVLEVFDSSNDSDSDNESDVETFEASHVDNYVNKNNYKKTKSYTNMLIKIVRKAIVENSQSSDSIEKLESLLLDAKTLEEKEKINKKLQGHFLGLPIVKKDDVLINVGDMSDVGTKISVFLHYRNEQYLRGEAMLKTAIRNELEKYQVNLLDNAYIKM